MAYSALDLANAFIKAGELDDALAALNDHLGTNPQCMPEKRLRAEILLRLSGESNLTAALQDLNTLTEHKPEDYIMRSVLLERLGRPQEMLASLAEAYESFPTDERLAERYVLALQAQGELQNAKVVVDRILEDHAQSWRWLQWAGDLSADLKDYDGALGYYNTAINIIKTRYSDLSGAMAGIYVRILMARADTRTNLKQHKLAEADYEQAMMIIPDDPMIRFNFGIVLADRDLDKSVEQCQQAYDNASSFYRKQMRSMLDSHPDLRSHIKTQL